MSINIQTAYKTQVKFPFGELGSMIEWCENNCSYEWKFGDSNDGYTFWFENEKDFVAFVMWKK